MADAGATRRVLVELRRRILRGDLLPGEQLRQEPIAGDLDVSRVPVREALMVLASEGLLTHQPNSGFVVTKRTPDELAQVHRLLGLLEFELLDGLTWPDRTTLLRLKNLNKRMAGLVDASDWVEVVHVNHEFHQTLWRLSPLNLIVGEVERVWGLADAYIAESYRSPTNRAAAVAEHQTIIEALSARDLEALQAAHHAHRESTRLQANRSMTPLDVGA
jgi:DNA-binding GntR family transcriptional regulator